MRLSLSRVRVCSFVLLALAGAAQAAESGATGAPDGLAWLKKMAAASRQLNYSGTIVYQHGNQVETSRVVHFVNPAGGEFEKLETLDGPPREVIRSNDQVVCYLPSSKTVLIEQRNRNTRNFPALLPESLGGLAENYTVRKDDVDRVAGHDCQWVSLVPRDNLRYGRRFCADLNTSLPLRAQTIDEKGQKIESFGFSEVAINIPFNRDRVKSKYAERSRAQRWRVDRSGFNPAPPTPGDAGWALANPPPGFKKLMEAKRVIGSRSRSVSQIVYTDGLAAISVFVEPLESDKGGQSLHHQGAVNIYTRPHGNYVVTVLGEAPQSTIVRIGDSLEPKSTNAALQ